MGYYLAEPYKNKSKYGDLIWEENQFAAYGTENRFWLYLNDYYIGELVNGYGTLNKKFHGDFHEWIKFLKNKDLNKIENARSMMKETEKTCVFIENLWKNINI